MFLSVNWLQSLRSIRSLNRSLLFCYCSCVWSCGMCPCMMGGPRYVAASHNPLLRVGQRALLAAFSAGQASPEMADEHRSAVGELICDTPLPFRRYSISLVGVAPIAEIGHRVGWHFGGAPGRARASQARFECALLVSAPVARRRRRRCRREGRPTCSPLSSGDWSQTPPPRPARSRRRSPPSRPLPPRLPPSSCAFAPSSTRTSTTSSRGRQ